jgi:hypothetical protein
MSDEEQQLEELQVLQSIYPDEFQELSSLENVPTSWNGKVYLHAVNIVLKPTDTDPANTHGNKTFYDINNLLT